MENPKLTAVSGSASEVKEGDAVLVRTNVNLFSGLELTKVSYVNAYGEIKTVDHGNRLIGKSSYWVVKDSNILNDYSGRKDVSFYEDGIVIDWTNNTINFDGKTKSREEWKKYWSDLSGVLKRKKS